MIKENVVCFLDSSQRTIFAERLQETETVIKVKNPFCVNLMPMMDREGQPMLDPRNNQPMLSISLAPVFFREFLANKEDETVLNYNKSSITMIDDFPGKFGERLYKQLEMLEKPPQRDVPVQCEPDCGCSKKPEGKQPEIVDLFS